MPAPISASLPDRAQRAQAPLRTSLIQLGAGRYTFEHKGVSYDVVIRPAPADNLSPLQHKRLTSILRILTTQVEADKSGAKTMKFSSQGHSVNGRPYRASDPARVTHYLTMLRQVLDNMSDALGVTVQRTKR